MLKIFSSPRRLVGKAFRQIPAVKKRDQKIQELSALKDAFKTPSFLTLMRSAFREEQLFAETSLDWGAYVGLGHKDGKREMREVANALGLKTPKLLGQWNTLDEINWDEMPDAFVLKTEYGHSGVGVAPLRRIDGGWQIVNSTRSGTIDVVLKPLRKRLGGESANGKFLAEELLGPVHENKLPVDMKIYSFYGQPALMWIRSVVDFYGGKRTKRSTFFDANGERVSNINSVTKIDDTIERPEMFTQAMEIAAQVSLAFRLPQVRVDLYEHEGEVYFGEVTSMCGHRLKWSFGDEWDRYLGELWEYANVRLKTDLAVGNINTSGPVIRTGTTPIQKDLFSQPNI